VKINHPWSWYLESRHSDFLLTDHAGAMAGFPDLLFQAWRQSGPSEWVCADGRTYFAAPGHNGRALDMEIVKVERAWVVVEAKHKREPFDQIRRQLEGYRNRVLHDPRVKAEQITRFEFVLATEFELHRVEQEMLGEAGFRFVIVRQERPVRAS
jgi:hypothetical protein